jgi:HD-GYP domain-containing protein (c-di-GMP phosphodiesterase class II)
LSANEDQKFLLDIDADVLEEFHEKFESIITRTETLALQLETHPEDIPKVYQLISLFKELYSCAVNANIAPLIEPLTTLEDFLVRFKDNYQADFTYPLTMLLDRLSMLATEAAEQYSISFTLINDIQRSIQPLARAKDSENVNESIKKVVKSLLGNYSTESEESNDDIELFSDVDLFDDVELFENDKQTSETREQVPKTPPVPASTATEIKNKSPVDAMQIEMQIISKPSAFRMLSEMIDSRHKYWIGRSYFLVSLAIKMNAEARNVVNPMQLANAIYIHDLPMIKFSDDLLYKRDLTPTEQKKLQMHAQVAYETASLMGESEECAEMVHQHHERPDGKGYPNQLTQDEICHGAKIIAICDAYYSMTNLVTYRDNLRSPIRAVAEINACAGTQFDPLWVKVFNRIVRKYNIIENIL